MHGLRGARAAWPASWDHGGARQTSAPLSDLHLVPYKMRGTLVEGGAPTDMIEAFGAAANRLADPLATWGEGPGRSQRSATASRPWRTVA